MDKLLPNMQLVRFKDIESSSLLLYQFSDDTKTYGIKGTYLDENQEDTSMFVTLGPKIPYELKQPVALDLQDSEFVLNFGRNYIFETSIDCDDFSFFPTQSNDKSIAPLIITKTNRFLKIAFYRGSRVYPAYLDIDSGKILLQMEYQHIAVIRSWEVRLNIFDMDEKEALISRKLLLKHSTPQVRL